ncbi:MAG: hypothetical protein EA393_01200 [Bacteroidetes bacterium]|nr:MAG: hypothetical protein EA393_01200 [Bacteroidota bacterium]
MNPATISEIKKALSTLNKDEIAEMCLRLAKYRKENKELLTYLIFEADDQAIFIKHVKEEIDHQFRQMNHSNIYLAKKTIRKVLRNTDKYIKFAASKQVEVELLMYFCKSLKDSGLPWQKHPVTFNIFDRQIKKIEKAIQSLHEDLQHDYGQELEILLKD